VQRYIILLLLVLAGGCASAVQGKIKRDARMATGCKDIKILDYSLEVARIDACGEIMTCYLQSRPGADALDKGLGVGGYWECR